MQRVAPISLLLAVATLLAGCGDDDAEELTTSASGTTGPVGALSLEQWSTQANRICAEGDRAQQQAAQQRFGDEPPSQLELEEFGATLVAPNLQAQHAAISGLPKPEAEAGRIDQLLDSLQEGIDAIAEDPGILVQGADSIPAVQEATEIAAELDLTDCGSG